MPKKALPKSSIDFLFPDSYRSFPSPPSQTIWPPE